jgi:hypothetical protein
MLLREFFVNGGALQKEFVTTVGLTNNTREIGVFEGSYTSSCKYSAYNDTTYSYRFLIATTS